MLQSLLSIGHSLGSKENTAILKMVHNERMAGSVPAWVQATSAKEETAQRFSDVLSDANEDENSSYRLSLKDHNDISPSKDAIKPFGFGDLLDIVNPLQHIPVISTFYRNITGDEIRGPGRIIGGAIFGGPLGAASSMINMLIEYDTGQDITEHATNMVFHKNNHYKTAYNASSKADKTTTNDVDNAVRAYQAHPIRAQTQEISYISKI